MRKYGLTDIDNRIGYLQSTHLHYSTGYRVTNREGGMKQNNNMEVIHVGVNPSLHQRCTDHIP